MMVTVRLSMTFHVTGVSDLDAHTDAVLDELSELENSSPGLADADIEATLSRGLVTVSLTATDESVDSAENTAQVAIRTAIHAAGGATPEWNSVPANSTITADYSFKTKELHAA